MIISVKADGSTLAIDADKINQGSNKANTIYFVAPFASNIVVNMSFKLPNSPTGIITSPYLMENITTIASPLNTWKLEVPRPLTQYYGNVEYSFRATNADGNVIATGRGIFKVNRGVDFELPEAPDEQTYELIIQKLSDIDGHIVNGLIHSKALFPYDEEFEYALGATVYNEANQRFYTSIVENNIGNALTDASKWRASTLTRIDEVESLISTHNSSNTAHPYIQNRINSVENEIEALDGRVETLEEGLEAVENDLSEFKTQTEQDIEDLNGAIQTVRASMPTKTSDLINDSGFITKDVDNLTNYYDKTAVDAKISDLGEVLEYKGSVDNYSDLPESAGIGDTYNVVNAYGDYPAGTNYAWNGEEWDALGGSIDLSNYYTKTETENRLLSAHKQIILDAEGVLVGDNYVYDITLPDAYTEYMTNNTKFLIYLRLGIVGDIDKSKGIIIKFKNDTNYLFNTTKGNEHLTAGDIILYQAPYNNETGYLYAFEATRIQNADNVGFMIVGQTPPILSIDSDQMDNYLMDGGLSQGQLAVCSKVITNGYTAGNIYRFKITYPDTYEWEEITQQIAIDTELSTTSTNPVQNKTITNYVTGRIKHWEITLNIPTSSWVNLNNKDPYKYKADYIIYNTSYGVTMSSDCVVELVNDDPVKFANYGFSLQSFNTNVINTGTYAEIYATKIPTEEVTLKILITGQDFKYVIPV